MDPNIWKQVRFFTRKEFDSKDSAGTGDLMHPRVVFALDAMRGLLDKPLPINSGYRTEQHNKHVGGAPKSAHLTGEAVDVRWSHLSKKERLFILSVARKLGFTGIGIAVGFCHLDIRPRVASWRYVAGGQVAIPVGQEAVYV